MERTFIVCAKVADHDADLLDQVPQHIRERFAGTAVRIIECEPEPDHPYDDPTGGIGADDLPRGPRYYTYDKVEVVEGLEVWTNECEQGKITKVADWPSDEWNSERKGYDDVWHEVTYSNGRQVHMNRERLSVRKPW